MIIFRKMTMTNFGPFAKAEIDWHAPGLTLIDGVNNDSNSASSNGAGKSHFFKALCWILYELTIEGDRFAEIIRAGQKLAKVDLKLQVDGRHYYIARTRSRSKGSLRLFKGNDEVTKASVRATQDSIIELLGLDFRTFRSTVLYGQGDNQRFAHPSTTDSERKAILKRALGMEILDEARAWVRSGLSTINRHILESEQAARIADASASRHDVGLLKYQIDGAKQEVATLKKKISKYREYEQLLSDAEGQLTEMKQETGEADAIRREIETLQRKQVEAEASGRDANRQLREIDDQVQLFAKGQCPTCGTPSDADSIVTKVTDLHSKKEKLRDFATKVRTVVGEMSRFIADAHARYREVNRVLNEIAQLERQTVPVRAELKAMSSYADQSRRTEERVAFLIDEQSKVEAKYAEALRQKTAAETLTSELQKHRKLYEFWDKGFSNEGLPSIILDSITAELAESANVHLGVLADGDITVIFDTETTLKSGKVKDEFTIEVDIEGAGNVQPSGGQWRKITLASNLALMDVVSKRAHSSIDLLLIDEALDGLDATGQDRVVDLLEQLKIKRSSIFVISHFEGIRDVFEQVITVRKQDGVASIEAAQA